MDLCFIKVGGPVERLPDIKKARILGFPKSPEVGLVIIGWPSFFVFCRGDKCIKLSHMVRGGSYIGGGWAR